MSLKMKLNIVNKHEYEENEDYREVIVRIPKENEKLERDFRYLGLDYNNLLAVCNGNRAARGTRRKNDLTCDAHRENEEFIKINPCKPETLETIFYSLDGKIDATDADL